jgi:antitoxin component YwqK of YwqJK toxin-antitoxin module
MEDTKPLSGIHQEFLPDGTLIQEFNYKDGKYHGTCKVWNDDGELILICNFKNGKSHGLENQCASGEENRIINYDNGHIEGEKLNFMTARIWPKK